MVAPVLEQLRVKPLQLVGVHPVLVIGGCPPDTSIDWEKKFPTVALKVVPLDGLRYIGEQLLPPPPLPQSGSLTVIEKPFVYVFEQEEAVTEKFSTPSEHPESVGGVPDKTPVLVLRVIQVGKLFPEKV
ncbi:hypothetical protein HG1285_03628 [Hydrogenivirga sp. 128-5-R1-1]|nr:hypothetical protein HG1285_03628 [Hydrogenivirga sp. 128-5-R1-1]